MLGGPSICFFLVLSGSTTEKKKPGVFTVGLANVTNMVVANWRETKKKGTVFKTTI